MPLNDNLPAEGTNPWYTPMVTAWENLKTFVNGLETSVNNKVNTATYTAGLAAKLDASQKGAANGVASLGADSKLTAAQLPDIAIADYLGAVANQAAMLALVGQKGDWAVRTDTGTTWIITGANPAVIGGWTQLSYPTAPVTSVASRTGAVVLTKTDVGLANADNTSDVNKPVSTAQAAADNLRVLTADVAGLNDPGWLRATVIAFSDPDPTGLPDYTLVVRLPEV